jgi:DNA primase
MLWSMSPAAERAVAYVEQRQMKDQVRPFSIGFAHTGLREHLRDVAEDKLLACGLLRKREGGEIIEFFRGRVMFPIHDQRGRVIGFGGRVLGDQQPKYLNSPDTPIFDKGRTLYNLHRAVPAARTAKRLLVVEGYMDVIGLASAGVAEVVAPNGTALTAAQIDALWRVCETPILCFDGDKAGRAAAARAATRALPLLKPDHSLAFVTPPEGKDPDDVARAGGREAVDAMLAKPRPLVEVLFEHEAAAGPLETPEQRAGLERRLRDHAATINDSSVARAYLEDFRRRYAERMSRAIGPRRAPLRTESSTERQPFIRREKPQTAASKAIGRGGIAESVERAVIAGLLRYPIVAVEQMEAVALAKFGNDNLRGLRDALLDAPDAAAFDVPEHLAAAAHYARTGPLRFTFTHDGAAAEVAQADLADALAQLRR